MGRFFYNLRQRYMIFMQGRYGNDELNLFLLITAFVLMVLSKSVFLWFLYPLSLVSLIFCIVRTYSRNISKRYEEKQKYLALKSRFLVWYRIRRDAWNNRKTHKYFRCKRCKASIRVPKHVGKIEVTCPKCGNRFIKKA